MPQVGNFGHLVSIAFYVLAIILPECYTITSETAVRRQTTLQNPLPFPAVDLLPPPALSSSFPTLKPRRAAPIQTAPIPQQGPGPQPQRDLIPPNFPFRPSQPIPAPQKAGPTQSPLPNAGPTQSPLPVLPPLEIPPERPLTDEEIEALHPKQTSFTPTTGKGAPELSLGLGVPQALPSIAVEPELSAGNSSSVRFPEETLPSSGSTIPGTNCPTCECTNQVDYICASNGVLYLNSCSFDCATFCDSGIRKVELSFCSSQNSK